MALGEFTKQLAQQAILSATKDPQPAAQPGPKEENLASVLLGQLPAMQKALKDEEDFLVFFCQGGERIRVLEIFLPSWKVAVLSGVDAERQRTRVVTPVECLQLITKVVKGQPGGKPARVPLILPKP